MIKPTLLQDVRQTQEYAQFMEKLKWRVVKENNCQVFIKKIPLLPFSLIKILRCHHLVQLSKLKKYKPLLIKIQLFMLNRQINRQKKDKKKDYPNYKKDKNPLIPTRTIWLNLDKTEKQLFKEMKKKVRRSIKRNLKRKLQIKIIYGDQIKKKQLKNFYYLWSKNRPFNWLFKPRFSELGWLVNSFGKKCFLVFASLNNQLVSAVLILTSKNMAFDWYGASSPKGRRLSAKSLVVWEAVKESKKQNLKVFDCEGIYDPRFHRCQKGWQGFSRFKRGFGGREIEFYPALIKLLPSWT